MPGISRVYWNDGGAFPVSGKVFSSHIVRKCLFCSTCCFDFWITDYKCFAIAPDPSFLFCFPGTWGSATVSKALHYKYPRTNVLWAAPSVPLIRQRRLKGSRGLGVFVTAFFLPLQPRWATLEPSFTTRKYQQTNLIGEIPSLQQGLQRRSRKSFFIFAYFYWHSKSKHIQLGSMEKTQAIFQCFSGFFSLTIWTTTFYSCIS